MKLEYFRGDHPNFGDELNTWLWPQLLPRFLDEDPSVLFIGIGSILGSNYNPKARKVVFGSGYVTAYHGQAPNVHGDDWDIFFVRGPRTTQALGIPDRLGIGDSAILLRALSARFVREPRHIGFMPHWESLPRGNWQKVCALAGIRLIDPRAPVEQVITEILGCEVLVAEAMHGAIVADALRVPWIPVLPIDHIHREKWFDWADALSMDLIQHRLWPSSLTELSRATMYRPLLSTLASGLTHRPISSLATPVVEYAAAKRLSDLAKSPPCMSSDGVIQNAVEQMTDKLALLQKKYGAHL